MATNERRTDSAEENLRGRFARGEIDAEEYERSLRVLRSGSNSTEGRDTKSTGAKPKLLVAGLAAAVLLTAGVGVAAQGQSGSSTGGTDMGSMMSSGQMSSMMNGQGMGSGQAMGSFDEEQPFDLQFIDQMTMHHEGAIMSSQMMIGDSERPELRQLAENIQQSQSEQIEQMQAFREEWYPDAGQTFGMPAGMMDQMMGDGSAMEQMMGDSMQELMGGDATDAMFLRMMIPHHQMAVDMADQALDKAENPELKELAQTIRDEQSAEIELMQGYLDEIEKTTNS